MKVATTLVNCTVEIDYIGTQEEINRVKLQENLDRLKISAIELANWIAQIGELIKNLISPEIEKLISSMEQISQNFSWRLLYEHYQNAPSNQTQRGGYDSK